MLHLQALCTHILFFILGESSALVLESVECFMAFQDNKFARKNIADRPVDLLSSIQHTQLAPEKALIEVDGDLKIK